MADQPNHRTDEDREFAAISEKDIWEEAKDRLKIGSEAEDDNRKRAKVAMEFREGRQWDDAPSVGEDEPELTINLTDAMVTRVENNIRQQRPRGKYHPVGDGANVELSETMNGLGRHVEARSEATVAYDMAASAALDGGFGYFRLIAEFVDPRSFQKDLRILPIRNAFTVTMDPGAIMPHGGDQNWCLISSKMKRQEYKRRYPKAANVAWNDQSREEGRLDWEDKEEVRLAEYFRIREKEEKLYLIRGQNGEEFTKYLSEMPRDPTTGKAMTLDEAEVAMKARGFWIDDERDSVKRQVEWFRLNGLKVVERQQLPGTYIPVFRVEGNARDIDGRVRRRGMIEGMMDPQRMVNYGEVAKIKRLGLAPKAPWVAAEGQLDGHPEWEDANQKAYTVLTYKPVIIETGAGPVMVPPPARQAPAQIEAGFSEFVQGMRSNLMAVAGTPNEPGQDPQGGNVVSGQALKRRQFLSDQSHFQYYDKQTLAIAQLWRVMAEWFPVYYSEDRMQRIIGEDSTPQMVPINKAEVDEETGITKIKNDLSIGRYDVVMDSGPGQETKREEAAENMIELVKIPALAELIVQKGADLLFRSIDHPYMQELADRLVADNPEGMQKVLDGLNSKAKAIVQYFIGQNKQLQQKLQQVEADLKYGITKTHLQETVKAHKIEEDNKTKRHDTETRAETQRFDTEASGEVALKVAEIRVGGQLLNTHVEAEHNRVAAQDALQTAEKVEKESP